MIIACTGHAEPEYIKKAWAHEMDEILIKPVSTDLIIAILDDTIDFQYLQHDQASTWSWDLKVIPTSKNIIIIDLPNSQF